MGNEPKSTDEGLKVGQILKKRRTSLRLSLPDVEVGTRIRGKYLVKLEASDYDSLSNDIYTRGFVVNYADYLGLDGAALAEQYVTERGGSIDTSQVQRPKPVQHRRWVLTPRMALAAAFVVGAGLVVTYLSWQFSALAAPPKLNLVSPVSDQVISGSVINLTGHVTPGADVMVNGSSILIDANSNFNDQLALQDGVNTINVTAKNKLGKTTTITRNILAHLPQLVAGQGSVPAQAFNGVAIDISIKNGPTAVNVTVDGQPAFQGTMLPGTVQDFKGTQQISLTTSDGGNTFVTVTNSAVAQKAVGAVGQNGEVKTNLIFAHDTQFQ